MASNAHHLVNLARIISESTNVLDSFPAAEGIDLSFSVDAADTFSTPAPPKIQEARRAVREATLELNQLVTGPSEHVRWFSTAHHDMSSLRWIYHFKLPSIAPEANSMSPSEERQIRIMDLEMLTMLNASERKISQWVALYHEADPRLKSSNVCKPKGSVNSIMEIVLESGEEPTID